MMQQPFPNKDGGGISQGCLGWDLNKDGGGGSMTCRIKTKMATPCTMETKMAAGSMTWETKTKMVALRRSE